MFHCNGLGMPFGLAGLGAKQIETAPLLTFNRSVAVDDNLLVADRARRLSRAGAPALGVRLRVQPPGGRRDCRDRGSLPAVG